VVLARELRANGRNICRVNGRTVSLSVLRQVADPLIDIHGQGEHLSLLAAARPSAAARRFWRAGWPKARRPGRRGAPVARLSSASWTSSAAQPARSWSQRIEMLQFKAEEIARGRAC
jgi:DNA repair protein RecN (Recombination protein N)